MSANTNSEPPRDRSRRASESSEVLGERTGVRSVEVEVDDGMGYAAEGPTLMWTADALAAAGLELPEPIPDRDKPALPPATRPKRESRSSIEIDPELVESSSVAVETIPPATLARGHRQPYALLVLGVLVALAVSGALVFAAN